MAKKISKTKVKKAKKLYKSLSTPLKVIVVLVIIAVLVTAGLYYYFNYIKKDNLSNNVGNNTGVSNNVGEVTGGNGDNVGEVTGGNGVVTNGEIAIHFLELGNKYSGDCIYIKAGENDILVDGGSRTNSETTIKNYVNNYVEDNTLEYVIVTHADRDHIACYAGDGSHNSLFDYFVVENIIDFPKTNKTSQTYTRYVEKRDAEVSQGAKHFTALECYNNEGDAKRVYDLDNGITLEILYNYYYENSSSSENNYSVCFMINHEENHYLFTGDLEKEGEKKLVENNTLPNVTLFKAGHHGSATSNTDELLSVIKPKYIAITCVAGSTEYSSNLSNVFPYQSVVDIISKYTENVFVTSQMELQETSESGVYEEYGDVKSLNGTIIFTCNKNEVSFAGTNNSTKFKDSEWFKKYRTCPAQWQTA